MNAISGSYLTYAQAHPETLSHNERLWSHCYGSSRKHCYNPEFLSQFCSVFPFQSLKTVRLRLNLTRQIIEDTNLNVQVLYLVRDPRGTLQSRKHRVWCPGEPDCDQPENLCSDLVKDYYAAQELMKQHPKRIRWEKKDVYKRLKLSVNGFKWQQNKPVLKVR